MGFVSLISEVNESGVPPLPLSSLFDTPSVRTSFDVSSEMSVFKTATSGSGTSMSSDMNKKVKNRSRVTSGTSMSSGMYKRAKKRSSETSDNSSSISSDISKKAKRRSSGKISNAGKNTSHATNDNSSSCNSTKSGNNTSHATNDNSSSGNSTEAGSVSLRSFGHLLVTVLGSKVPTIKDCLKEIAHLREKVEAGQVLRAEQILPVMEALLEADEVCVQNF